MKIKELKIVAKELNGLLFDESKKKDGWIELDVEQSEMEVEIKKAFKYLEFEEEKELSKVLQKTLKELVTSKEYKEWHSVEVTDSANETNTQMEDKEEQQQELSLEEMVENAVKLNDLKKICKTDESFKSLKKGLKDEKNVKALRKKMLDLLKDEQTEVPEKKEEKKVGKKETPKKSEKLEKEVKKSTEKKSSKKMSISRLEAAAMALKKCPKTKKEWAELTDKVMLENGGTVNLSEAKKQCMHVTLISKVFPLDNLKIPTK